MIVGVVPARGGSKRLPRKNIARLAGRPMLVYTIEAGIGALGRERVFVSTEDAEIAEVARAAGAAVIERPAALASDSASTESALLHALQDARVRALQPTWLMTLPPTSPMRDAAAIRAFMREVRLDRDEADCYLSVTEVRGDYWRRFADGRWSRLFPDAPRRQQEREPLFEENSAIYLSRVAALEATSSVLGRRPIGIPIPHRAALDVNDARDLEYAQWLLKEGR